MAAERNSNGPWQVYVGVAFILVLVASIAAFLWLGERDSEWYDEGQLHLLELAHRIVEYEVANGTSPKTLGDIDPEGALLDSLNDDFYSRVQYRYTTIEHDLRPGPFRYKIEIGDIRAANPPYIVLHGDREEVEIEYYSSGTFKYRTSHRIVLRSNSTR